MTPPRLLELALALALIVAGVLLYRRRDPAERYGSQGAVLLFAVGAIVTVHALGLMHYRPSAAEAGLPHGALR